jgi:predicted dithiol-disulfide oxidoreductase (DUF899 family)
MKQQEGTMSEPVHFPNETPEYRAARRELLAAEVELRRRTEDVAALRRRLPLGGRVPEDYVFDEGTGQDGGHPHAPGTARLSELFAPDRDTLVLYSFMYGPAMPRPCPMCTSFLDGLDGQAHHLTQRVSLAVTARSPIARIRAFAEERGWRRLRLLSDAGNDYHRAYLGESPDGKQLPMMNVFVKRDGAVFHHWGSEVLYAGDDPGQNSRHIDSMWPLWNVLDLTPGGRGETFFPKLAY